MRFQHVKLKMHRTNETSPQQERNASLGPKNRCTPLVSNAMKKHGDALWGKHLSSHVRHCATAYGFNDLFLVFSPRRTCFCGSLLFSWCWHICLAPWVNITRPDAQATMMAHYRMAFASIFWYNLVKFNFEQVSSTRNALNLC